MGSNPYSSLSGVLGNQSCAVTASAIGFHLDVAYSAEPDSLDGAYIDALNSAQTNALGATFSGAGCGAYASLIPLLGPYVIPQIQAALDNQITKLIPKPGGPGVRQTICPAP